jgi:hypothetical protein
MPQDTRIVSIDSHVIRSSVNLEVIHPLDCCYIGLDNTLPTEDTR